MSRQRQAILRVLALEEQKINTPIEPQQETEEQASLPVETKEDTLQNEETVPDNSNTVLEQPVKKKSPFPSKKKKSLPQE